MKKSSLFLLCSVVQLLISGCDTKEVLNGKREPIKIVDSSEIAKMLSDQTPVRLSEAIAANQACEQPFYNASHSYDQLKLSLNPVLKWTTNLDYPNTSEILHLSSAVVSNGRIFCIDAGGIVYALSAKDGKKLWATSTTIKGKDGQIGGAIACINEKLIATSSFAECFCFDANNGKILWRIKLPAPCKGDGITIYNGVAYLQCNNSSLHAIDIKDGSNIWSHSGMTSNISFVGSSCPAIVDNAVYVAYSSGDVYALSAENGNVIWESILSKTSLTNATHSFVHPRACPVFYDGVVYVVASNHQTVAIDAKTGERIWTSECGGVQTPIVCGNSIFVFNSQSTLMCLNNKTGKMRWSVTLDNIEDSSNWYGMSLINGHVLMISPNGKMMFVGTDGKIKKVIQTGKTVRTCPVIANECAYILSDDASVSSYK